MIVCVRTNLSILADFVLLLTTMTNTMKLAEVHFFLTMSRFPCSAMAVCKQSVLLWGHMAFIFRAPPGPQCLLAGSIESHSCMPAWCMLPTPKLLISYSTGGRISSATIS